MTLRLRIFARRLRRTYRDYFRIWRPPHRRRLAQLWRCWQASRMLVIVLGDGTIKEVP